jgi:HNH endonuclease/AP2 domain
MAQCKADGCENTKHKAHGYCQHHYDRWRRGEPASNPTTEQRFWSKVNKDGPTMPLMDTPCWVWTEADHGNGYGRFYYGGKKFAYAHRVAYELANGFGIGELSLRFVVDHKCHNKVCCNPFHLRDISQKQNVENHQGAQRNNISTGVRGVARVGNRFYARFNHNGKQIHVGAFGSIEEAEAAVVAARCELWSHNDIDRKRSA